MDNFAGIHYVVIPNEDVWKIEHDENEFLNSLRSSEKLELVNNDYLIVMNEEKKAVGKYKIKNNLVVKLPYVSIGKGKDSFAPLNVEQECAFDLMADSDIKVKVITGIAGTGKTKMAVKFGFEKLKNGEVSKIFLVRNPSHVGEKVGFHKGSKNEKVINWNNPIKDNMEDRFETLEELIAKGRVEVDIPSEMKGRDLKDCWIIVDEAEDLSEEVFKMIGERVSEGSYITFVGDIGQVSNKKYKKNSGLRRAFSLRGKTDIFGSVELKTVVRSDVSNVFATLY